MKRHLRDAVLGTAEALGVNRALTRSRWRGDRLLILCYHGFALRDEHHWDPQLFVSGATFRQRLGYLRDNRFNVLRLEEALSHLRAKTLPERAVVLTVDDGLYDFSAVALPLLQEFGFPATVYVSTYYVEHPWPVFNVMASYLLWLAAAAGHTALRLELLGPGDHLIGPSTLRLRTWEHLKTAVEGAGLSARAKERLLGQIAERFGIDYPALRDSRVLTLLRLDELRALDPALVDLQLHTHRHRVPEDRELFLREIRDNRAVLARAGKAEQELVHFCYPSGVHRPMFLPWLREAGVVSATTTEPGLVSQRNDPLLLPRFIDTEATAPSEFAAWTSGLRAVLNRRALGL